MSMRHFWLVIFCFLLLVVALIFLKKSNAQTTFKQPKQVTVSLPKEYWQFTVNALAKLPYEESAPVIEAIMQQVNKQILPAPDTTGSKK